MPLRPSKKTLARLDSARPAGAGSTSIWPVAGSVMSGVRGVTLDGGARQDDVALRSVRCAPALQEGAAIWDRAGDLDAAVRLRGAREELGHHAPDRRVAARRRRREGVREETGDRGGAADRRARQLSGEDRGIEEAARQAGQQPRRLAARGQQKRLAAARIRAVR